MSMETNLSDGISTINVTDEYQMGPADKASPLPAIMLHLVAYLTVFIVCILGNLLLVFLIRRKPHLRTPACGTLFVYDDKRELFTFDNGKPRSLTDIDLHPGNSRWESRDDNSTSPQRPQGLISD
ncbi:G-protein coupled receptor [Branchiostoma belcheri]|nr:G-protein coupled receptor [Branchiostoma belcheri]